MGVSAVQGPEQAQLEAAQIMQVRGNPVLHRW